MRKSILWIGAGSISILWIAAGSILCAGLAVLCISTLVGYAQANDPPTFQDVIASDPAPIRSNASPTGNQQAEPPPAIQGVIISNLQSAVDSDAPPTSNALVEHSESFELAIPTEDVPASDSQPEASSSPVVSSPPVAGPSVEQPATVVVGPSSAQRPMQVDIPDTVKVTVSRIVSELVEKPLSEKQKQYIGMAVTNAVRMNDAELDAAIASMQTLAREQHAKTRLQSVRQTLRQIAGEFSDTPTGKQAKELLDAETRPPVFEISPNERGDDSGFRRR